MASNPSRNRSSSPNPPSTRTSPTSKRGMSTSGHIHITVHPDGNTQSSARATSSSPTLAQFPWGKAQVRSSPTVGGGGSPEFTTPSTPVDGAGASPGRGRTSGQSKEERKPGFLTSPKVWKGTSHSRGSSAASSSTSMGRFVDMTMGSLSALWVNEPDTEKHAHGDEDIPTSSHSLPPSFPARLYLAYKRQLERKNVAISRLGAFLVLFLLLLGIREIYIYSRPRTKSVRVKGRDPFRVLHDMRPPEMKTHSLGALATQDRLWRETNDAGDFALQGMDGDTTAIVLHWKRTDNVVVIVAHLCQYSFLHDIVVWNNNPDIHLTRETFESARCPASKLRIYNSPRNMLFLARYLACSYASTPYCFFQDDDWLVQPLRALYSQFSRDPEGPVVVHTNPEVATLYGLEWCFYQSSLHTCFSWVGTGAFVAKSHVTRFLSTIGSVHYQRDELGHADNSFTLFQNEPPYVLSGPLSQLPQPFGHSDGAGIERNKGYIQRGLHHISKFLGIPSSSPQLSLPTLPSAVDVDSFRTSPAPPLWPHPWAHHARSPCISDTCTFVTNVPLLPPPDAAPYPGPGAVTLGEWENHLGWFARGWVEGGEMFAEDETWAIKWAYSGAVDGDYKTAFRSPDIIQPDDYVGLGLLAPVDPQWLTSLSLYIVMEEADRILPNLKLEVSIDGYRWYDPRPEIDGRAITPICKSTSHESLLPDLSFPNSYLASLKAKALRKTESDQISSSILTAWWKRRTRKAKVVKECKYALGTRIGEDANSSVGWRFVRLRAEKELDLGWAVYEFWLA